MATVEKQSPDLVVPPDSIESQGTLVIYAGEKSAGSQNLNEEIPLTNVEDKTSKSGPCNSTSIDLPGDKTDEMGFLDAGTRHTGVFQPNIYAPQVQTIYYGGYENPPIEWDDYPQFLNPEGMETGSHGASLIFHTGYGYTPQMPYGAYSPVTAPLSSSSGDNQMYTTQQFTFAGPYFQQPGPVTMPYLNSPAPVSQVDLTMPVGTEQGFGGFGSGGLWSDWLKSRDGRRPLTPFSPTASSPPSSGFGTFGHSLSPFSSGMDSQQQGACGFGSSAISYDRGYSYTSMFHQGANFGANLGKNARGWLAIDKGSWLGKGSTSFCSCNGSLDLLSEQNRGPRATRPKNLNTDPNPSTDGKNITSTAAGVVCEYNKPDFVTEYEDAKFFIIKSYSEDNVHKSIKYSVWASTPNGNRRLDLAYREAKEKETANPVFLFFSVNASGQFCGVAEMIGPVDFEKSVDYWQQDKWSGQFPVKWHIVKDVPNSLFRHIILENNGNKPVTNSRDTQEVKLEEGLKMLNIFKNHEADMSILDDFDFYEERQRAIQERKAWQQQKQQQRQPNSVIPSSAVLQHSPAHLTGDFTNQMPKTFAQAVRLDEKNRRDPEVAGKGSLTTTAAKAGDLAELTATGM